MKLFQQLLVAPAALGLMAPLAANAVEVNINDVATYSDSEVQTETTAQFSDVVPGDWAYTALQGLSESYGCVDNAYTQSLRSGQALTRFEAAALVNACLDGGLVASGQGLTSEAARLTNEFGSEMAILKGRVDGLEYRLNEFDAGTFSSTTLMSGSAVFTTGAVDNSTLGEKVSSVYSYGIDLTTSFTGKDSLDTSIIAGNNAAATNPLGALDSAESTTNQALTIDSLQYTFPWNDFTVTAGPLMKQADVVSATLSTYSDNFYISNQPYSTEDTEVGPGVGAVYYFPNGNWNASLSLVADDGDNSDATNGGIFTREGDDIYTASIGYDGDTWGGGLIIASGDDNGSLADKQSWGYGIYWSPEDSGASISLGFDTEDNEGAADNEAWTIGVDYEGIGPGTLSSAYQAVDNETETLSKWEIYYNWEVADGISVQPGFFTNEISNADDETGAAVEVFFKF